MSHMKVMNYLRKLFANMEQVQYLIVGAGISGLSFARSLKEKSYLVVEKEPTAGGLCRTHYKNEYVWDFAGHFFHFSNEEIKSFFDKRVKADDLVFCNKETKIILKNKYIDYPFQTNIHQLEKQDFIDCLYDLYFKDSKENFKDFEDMLYAKFGKSITELFLKPYNEKLYACSLKKLDTNAMGRFFPYADLKDVIKNMKESRDSSYNNSFEYPKRGAQVFIEALLSDIDMDNLMLNTEVKNIDIKNKKATIESDKEEMTVEYEYLINTVPLNVFTELCNTEVPENVLSYNQVLVYNIGFDSALEDTSSHWIYFYRVGFYNNILSETKGSTYVELGFDPNMEITKEIKDMYYHKTLEDLRNCGIVSDQKTVAHETLVINPGYVHITEQGKKWVERYMAEMAKKKVYSIGRYGAWTYCSMEDCMLQALKLSKEIG